MSDNPSTCSIYLPHRVDPEDYPIAALCQGLTFTRGRGIFGHLAGRTAAFVGLGLDAPPYAFSGQGLMRPQSPNQALIGLVEQLRAREVEGMDTANVVLLNLYDSNDGPPPSIGWHSDDEACVDQNCAIVSLSFGVPVKFNMRPQYPANTGQTTGHKRPRRTTTKQALNSGDIFVMQPGFQDRFEHGIPSKDFIEHGERLSLTFRTHH
jgi:alkylated DNA repair dioxygenase AlkB